jgi:hypothetical protein
MADHPLESLYREINKDPEAKRLLHQSIKKVRPSGGIAEVEAEDRIRTDLQKTIDEQAKQIKELAEAVRRDQLTERFNRERAELRAKFSLSEEQLKAADKLIEDGRVLDLATAAEHIHLQSKPLTPSGYGGLTPPVRDEEKDWREQVKDPRSELRARPKTWAKKNIPKLIEEVFSQP